MTPTLANGRPAARRAERRGLVAHAEGRGGAVLAVPSAVPAHLLDGDEIICFAIKPSPWFVLLVSLRWIVLAVVVGLLADSRWAPAHLRWYLWQSAVWIAALRLGWAVLEWVSRLYVLTDRRAVRIRGVFNVELFECPLSRIQDTYVSLSIAERLTRIGTVTFRTASGGGGASWRMVSRPLEVHEKLREAIRKSGARGLNGL
jgi:uncharacterized membrane protein YdbT with pleckstrin-like domain